MLLFAILFACLSAASGFPCLTKHLGKTEPIVKYRLQCCDIQSDSSGSVQGRPNYHLLAGIFHLQMCWKLVYLKPCHLFLSGCICKCEMGGFRPNCLFCLYRYPSVAAKVCFVYLKEIATITGVWFEVGFRGGEMWNATSPSFLTAWLSYLIDVCYPSSHFSTNFMRLFWDLPAKMFWMCTVLPF